MCIRDRYFGVLLGEEAEDVFFPTDAFLDAGDVYKRQLQLPVRISFPFRDSLPGYHVRCLVR